MKCPRCGNKVEKDQKVCRNCGARLERKQKLQPRRIPVPVGIGCACVLVLAVSIFVMSPSRTKAGRLQEKIAMGNKFLNQADFEKAEVAFHEALAIDEKSPDAALGMAKAYNGQGSPDRALEMLKQASTNLDSRPLADVSDDADVWKLKSDEYEQVYDRTSELLTRQGDTEKAREAEEEKEINKRIFVDNDVLPTPVPEELPGDQGEDTSDDSVEEDPGPILLGDETPDEIDNGSENGEENQEDAGPEEEKAPEGSTSGEDGEREESDGDGEEKFEEQEPEEEIPPENSEDGTKSEPAPGGSEEAGPSDILTSENGDSAQDSEEPKEGDGLPEPPSWAREEEEQDPADDETDEEIIPGEVVPYPYDGEPSEDVVPQEQDQSPYEGDTSEEIIPGEVIPYPYDGNTSEDVIPQEQNPYPYEGGPGEGAAPEGQSPYPYEGDPGEGTAPEGQSPYPYEENTDVNPENETNVPEVSPDELLSDYASNTMLAQNSRLSLNGSALPCSYGGGAPAGLDGIAGIHKADLNGDGVSELLVIRMAGGALTFDIYKVSEGTVVAAASGISPGGGFGNAVESSAYQGVQVCFLKGNGVGIASEYTGVNTGDGNPSARTSLTFYSVSSDGSVSQTVSAVSTNGTDADSFISQVSGAGFSGSWIHDSADVLSGMDLANNPVQDMSGVPMALSGGLAARESGVQDLVVVSGNMPAGSGMLNMSLRDSTVF